MSFKAFQPTDIVVSSDSITSTLWSTNTPQLTTFFTSSTQAASSAGTYYYNVYQTSSLLSGSAVQFAIAYGNADGSGSLIYNTLVNGLSPTATIYGQYQDLILGDENSAASASTNFVFGNISSSEFYAISFERACYKESLFLGSLSLTLSGSSKNLVLTDNSNYVTSVQYTNGGTRVFQLISGSLGVKYSGPTTTIDGYSANSGSYGWFLPDIGTILLNPKALAAPAISGGMAFNYSGSATGSATPNVTPMTSLFAAISGGASFYINSQETITSDYVFVRPQSSEFNYSENPSFISGSTGEVIYSQFINNPQVYITTVGLYNDANELLAVAKLSRPLQKDFTSEALIRVKLDF
jgi:hypothetical protein